MIARVVIATALALAVGAAAAQGRALTAAETERYHALVQELRCVICQNRAIAESDAPLAADMRQLVRGQIRAGRSDAEIKQYLVDRYGEWVLYRPRFEPATWLLWLGPGLLLLTGLLTAFWLWRRATARPEPPPPDAAAIDRLLRQQEKHSE